MSTYGFRDGAFNVKTLKLGQKRLVEDVYTAVLASNSVLIASASIVASSDVILGTTLDHPRTIRAKNHLKGVAERQAKLVVKGYTGQGEYAEETLTLATAAQGSVYGNVAFAYITSINGATSTLGYGTYSSVSIYPANKFGLTEYCETDADILDIQLYDRNGLRAVSTTVISTTNYSIANQTINLNSLNPIGSTVAIKYRSKFQIKDKY